MGKTEEGHEKEKERASWMSSKEKVYINNVQPEAISTLMAKLHFLSPPQPSHC